MLQHHHFSIGTYFSIKCYLDQILMMRSQDGKCFSAPQDWKMENLFSAVNFCTIQYLTQYFKLFLFFLFIFGSLYPYTVAAGIGICMYSSCPFNRYINNVSFLSQVLILHNFYDNICLYPLIVEKQTSICLSLTPNCVYRSTTLFVQDIVVVLVILSTHEVTAAIDMLSQNVCRFISKQFAINFKPQCIILC